MFRQRLAHLESGLRPAPLPLGDLSTLEADIVRELRACAQRLIARAYRGQAAKPQALAIWRGLIEPAKALGFAQITRLGRTLLAQADKPAPRPRAGADAAKRAGWGAKRIELYAPVVTRQRVA